MDFWLEHFIPFIQSMGAVNIVYVATHFPAKIYDLFFNEKRIEDELSELRNKINAGAGAVQNMGHMTRDDGKTNENAVGKLKKDYNDLLNKWDGAHRNILKEAETARNVKGAKSLFLNITLYCMLMMFAIIAFATTGYNFFRLFIMAMNVVTTLYICWITYIMWHHKWDKKEECVCYKKTFWIFVVQVIVSVILAAASLWAVPLIETIWLIPSCISLGLLLLCLFLPVYPCLITVIFIFVHERKINQLKEKISSDFIDEQEKLDKRKKEFEEMDQMFTTPDAVTFRQ